MKALSLTQPWGSLVALGEKRFETRSWSTPVRGTIAIHASKGFTGIGGKREFLHICSTEPFCSVLQTHGLAPADLPLGAIVAVAELTQTAPTQQVFSYLRGLGAAGVRELEFGDYTSPRFAFELTNVQAVEPIPCSGALGFWDVPADVARLLLARTGVAA